MGVIVRISKENKEDARKALHELSKKRKLKNNKTLAHFYGKMRGVYGDGLTYQKKIRNEWQ